MAPISFKHHRFPADVIRQSVWLYFKFTLSVHDIEELIAQRGVDVGREAICNTFDTQPHLISRPSLRTLRAQPTNRGRLSPRRPDPRGSEGRSTACST